MKSALEDRYLLLPYLYTLMYKAHKHGDMVVTPLLANYPSDKQTWEIDEQLMWGDGVLISPVLYQGETSVRIRSKTLLAIIYIHKPNPVYGHLQQIHLQRPSLSSPPN